MIIEKVILPAMNVYIVGAGIWLGYTVNQMYYLYTVLGVLLFIYLKVKQLRTIEKQVQQCEMLILRCQRKLKLFRDITRLKTVLNGDQVESYFKKHDQLHGYYQQEVAHFTNKLGELPRTLRQKRRYLNWYLKDLEELEQNIQREYLKYYKEYTDQTRYKQVQTEVLLLDKDYAKSIAILGLPHDFNQSMLKRNYRLLAKKYHPDNAPGKANKKHFNAIQGAYEYLLQYKE